MNTHFILTYSKKKFLLYEDKAAFWIKVLLWDMYTLPVKIVSSNRRHFFFSWRKKKEFIYLEPWQIDLDNN